MDQETKFCKNCGTPVDPGTGHGYGKHQGVFARLKDQLRNTEDVTDAFNPADIQANKAFSALSYFIFFLPLLACPDSRFGRFHANQALLLAITFAGWSLSSAVLKLIPFLGWLISSAGYVILAAFLILSIVHTFDGRAKRLPFIGSIDLLK